MNKPKEEDLFSLSEFKKIPTHLQNVIQFIDFWKRTWNRLPDGSWEVRPKLFETEMDQSLLIEYKDYEEAYRVGYVTVTMRKRDVNGHD